MRTIAFDTVDREIIESMGYSCRYSDSMCKYEKNIGVLCAKF